MLSRLCCPAPRPPPPPLREAEMCSPGRPPCCRLALLLWLTALYRWLPSPIRTLCAVGYVAESVKRWNMFCSGLPCLPGRPRDEAGPAGARDEDDALLLRSSLRAAIGDAIKCTSSFCSGRPPRSGRRPVAQ